MPIRTYDRVTWVRTQGHGSYPRRAPRRVSALQTRVSAPHALESGDRISCHAPIGRRTQPKQCGGLGHAVTYLASSTSSILISLVDPVAAHFRNPTISASSCEVYSTDAGGCFQV
jgi:hypothetical protein